MRFPPLQVDWARLELDKLRVEGATWERVLATKKSEAGEATAGQPGGMEATRMEGPLEGGAGAACKEAAAGRRCLGARCGRGPPVILPPATGPCPPHLPAQPCSCCAWRRRARRRRPLAPAPSRWEQPARSTPLWPGVHYL